MYLTSLWVKQLVLPVKGSNKNVTLDNWLAFDLSRKKVNHGRNTKIQKKKNDNIKAPSQDFYIYQK